MKIISAIHSAITENTENLLVKCAPHTSMSKSHDASISAMSNLFHSIISEELCKKCLCDLTLKPLDAVVNSKKEWGHKGVQR